jgi:hypothetical protein
MLRNLISVLTMVSLLVTSFLSEVASAATKAEKEAKQVEKIKQKVRKVGTDEYARITVGLKNQSKELKGYVSEIAEDSFVVMNSKTKVATSVAYRDVTYIRGKGLPPIAIVGITVGAVLGTLLIIAVAAHPYD